MDARLNMSLDEMIKSKPKSRPSSSSGGGRSGGGGRGDKGGRRSGSGKPAVAKARGGVCSRHNFHSLLPYLYFYSSLTSLLLILYHISCITYHCISPDGEAERRR